MGSSPNDKNSRPLKAASTPIVLAFHKVLSTFSFSSTNFSPRRLHRLMTALSAKGYTFAAHQETAANDVENSRTILVTFDDGYRHLAEVLPTFMQDFGIMPVVFVPTKYIGKRNTWDYSFFLQPLEHLTSQEIRSLSEMGVRFGSHSHSHIDLRSCSSETLRRELEASKKILEDITGKPITLISYPFGRYSPAVLDMVRELGYTEGFTMRFPTENDSPLTRGRYGIYGYDSVASVFRKISGGKTGRFEAWKARMTNRLSYGTILLNHLLRRK